MAIGSIGGRPDPLFNAGPVAPPSDPVFDPMAGAVEQGSLQDLFDSNQIPTNIDIVNLPPGSITWRLFVTLLSGARLGLKRQLQAAQLSDQDFTRLFYKLLTEDSSGLLNSFTNLEASITSQKIGENLTGPKILELNAAVPLLKTAITNLSSARTTLATATATFQTAISVFNALVSAGFEDEAARDAAIEDYNEAVSAYNNALDAYHSVRDATMDLVDSYNGAILTYNNLLDSLQAQIDAENQRRANNRPPLPLLPDQERLDSFDFEATDTLEHHDELPFSTPSTQPDATSPPIIQTPIFPPDDRVDPRTLDFATELANVLMAEANRVFGAADFFSRFVEAIEEETKSLDPNAKLKVLPDAFAAFDPIVQLIASGQGGVALASLTIGLDNRGLEALISRGLFMDELSKYVDDPSSESYNKIVTILLLALSRGKQLAILPGTALIDIDNVAPDSATARIALSLGLAITLIGLVRFDNADQAIQTLVKETPELSSLTTEEQAQVAQFLAALLVNSLLLTAVGSLATELDNPAIFGVFSVAEYLEEPARPPGPARPPDTAATLVGDVDATVNRYGVETVGPPGTAATLVRDVVATVNRYGVETVAQSIGNLVISRLRDVGIKGPAAEKAATIIAQRLTTEELPVDFEDLKILVKEPLEAIPEAVDRGAVESVAEGIVLFAAAVGAKQTVQESLIARAGPQAAISLSNDIVSALYGFSVDFNEGTIIQAQNADERPSSVLQATREQIRTFAERGHTDAVQKLSDNFREAMKENVSVAAYLTKLIERAHTFYSLMTQGTGGTHFERGSIDIKL